MHTENARAPSSEDRGKRRGHNTRENERPMQTDKQFHTGVPEEPKGQIKQTKNGIIRVLMKENVPNV